MPRFKQLFAWAIPLIFAGLWLQREAGRPELPLSAEAWFLAVVSASANVVVLAYHFAIPAHPKFLMRPWRRSVLRVHVIAGCVELVAGLIACFLGSPLAATVMALVALGLHVPSALLQLPIVFGSRAIMEPAYLLCITAHGFCAAMLLRHPDSSLWAVNTFLVFNIYVWCRLYFYVFDVLQLFRPMKYSAAILAAGFTVLPAVFGQTGVLACIGFVGLYVGTHRLLVFPAATAFAEFSRERARDSHLPAATLERLDAALPPATVATASAAWFRKLDRAGDGALSRNSLLRALLPWGLPAASTAAFADRLLREGPVTCGRFEANVWSVGAIRQHALRTLALEGTSTDRERATLVFQLLDFDQDGSLTREELDWLLDEWALPASETDHYLRQAADDQGRITLTAFIAHLEPVWRYVFDEILRANFSARGNEMIQRGAATAAGHRNLSVRRAMIRRELLQSVPFLAAADDALISNLAASLTIETLAAGTVVMREGEPGEVYYLIASGGVRIERAGMTIAHLGPGSSIGEGSLLTQLPRSATVVTTATSTLLALARPAFAHLTANYPRIGQHLEALHDERSRTSREA